MPIRLTSLLFAATAAILLPSAESFAQNRTAGGGGFGGGTSFGGGSSFGQSALGGQSGFGGQSSFGQSGLGGASSGLSAFGSGNTSGLGAASTGEAGTTPFVGRGPADLKAFFGGLNEAFSNVDRSQRNSRRSSSSGEAGRRPLVRVKLVVSPELAAAAESRRATLRTQPNPQASRTSRLLAQRGLSGVAFEIVGGNVILSGVVETESEKLLAEKLFAIEPGIRAVDNRLSITSDVPEIVPAPR